MMIKGGMGNLLRQAQKMQEEMQKSQEKLQQLSVTGESGGGAIKVVMSGKHEVKSISIDKDLVGDDFEMLEDLLTAAMNDAANKVAEVSQEQMAGMAGGLNLPPGFKLPF
ncbi:MAG: YbaB/EbfC family nucleoid-associated protein [bacterium]